jgi:phosphoribosyl-ATP pyrophosphohydrolase
VSDILAELDRTLMQRRNADPESSYVAGLHRKGLNRILEKVGEEAAEVIIAAKDSDSGGGREALVGEVADLWFHCMVMLSHLDGNTGEVLECLRQRFGLSGLEEKARRGDPAGTDA